MRHILKTAILNLILLCFIVSVFVPSTAAENDEDNFDKAASEPSVETGFKQIAENEHFILNLHQSTYEISLTDRETGYTWYSSPRDRENDKLAFGRSRTDLHSAFTVSYRDKNRSVADTTNTYAGSMLNGDVRVKEESGGATVYYKFNEIKCIVPIRYKLEEDGLSCTILSDEITEGGDCVLLSVSILPFFGAGSVNEEGYLLIPDGSGALMNFNNGKSAYSAYSEKVYGRDENLNLVADTERKQSVRLPVFGVQKGDNGFLAVITEGEALASVEACVSGKTHSYNQVNAAFTLRAVDTYFMGETVGSSRTVTIYEEKPAGCGNLTVKYYPLNKENSGYSGMARKYREHLSKLYKLREKPQQASLHLELLGAVRQTESFLGIVPVTKTVALTGFSEASDIITDLRESGVENIDIRYTGWSKDQVTGKVMDNADVLGCIGGKSGLKKLLSLIENQPVSLYLDSDFYKVQKWNGAYSKNKTGSKTVSQKPAYVYEYSFIDTLRNPDVKPSFLISPEKSGDIAAKFLKSFKKLENVNLSVGDMTASVSSDFRKSGWSRQDSVKAVQKTLASLSEGTPLMVKGGNAYALGCANIILDAPESGSGFNMTDESVPFYQMAVSGLASYSYSPINLTGDSKRLFLKSVETGAMPRFTWIGGGQLKDTGFSNFYSVSAADWYGRAVEYYSAFCKVNLATEGSALYSHKKIQANVYETAWQNGCTVITNFGKENVMINGTEIPAEDYKIMEGS